MCLTINFTEEENRLLNSYAKVHSTSVSDIKHILKVAKKHTLFLKLWKNWDYEV